MRKRARSRRLRIAALGVALVAAAACRPQRAPADDAAPELPSKPTTTEAPQPDPEAGRTRIVYPGAPGSFVQIAEDVERSVVSIQSSRKVVGGPAEDFGVNEEFALGTGFLVDSTGYVLTNDHIIANAVDVSVLLHDGTKRAAKVVGRDPDLDVALLNIDGASGLRPLPRGDSDRTEVGEWLVAAGNPFGIGLSVTSGIVSMRPEKTKRAIAGKDFYHAYMHTDLTINSGNSGGPVVNMAGEVVGIAVAIDRNKTGVGYVIPINRVNAILPQLKTEGVVKRAWLGAWVKPVTPDLARQLGLDAPAGALVTGTMKGSPAQRAGLKKGDVILEYDSRKVDDRSLPWVVATTGIGRHVPISVWRNRRRIALDVVTEKMPN